MTEVVPARPAVPEVSRVRDLFPSQNRRGMIGQRPKTRFPPTEQEPQLWGECYGSHAWSDRLFGTCEINQTESCRTGRTPTQQASWPIIWGQKITNSQWGLGQMTVLVAKARPPTVRKRSRKNKKWFYRPEARGHGMRSLATPGHYNPCRCVMKGAIFWWAGQGRGVNGNGKTKNYVCTVKKPEDQRSHHWA